MYASHSMSGEVEVAYSAGRRNGHVGAVPACDVGDLLRVRGDDDALEAAALACRLDRVREKRMTGERADVLPGDALRAGTSRDERDRARRAHPRPAATASSVSVGAGDVEPLGGAETAPRIASSSERRPAATSLRGRGRRLVGHLVDDRPLGGRHAARRRPPPRPRTPRRSPRRVAGATPDRCAARRRRDRRPRSPPPAGRYARACARGRASRSVRRARRCARAGACRPPARPPSRESVSDAMRDRPGRRRLDDLHASGAVGLEVGDGCRRRRASPKRARSTSMCSRPLSSGSTTPSLTASGSTRSTRVVETRRLDRHEEEVDGLRELLDHLDASGERSLRATRRRDRRAR